ncbi:PKD domain-containing protein [Kitasatospora sp. NPDC059747]|uniref:PKD domain-containing protein n=2 Tax=unclassified Kitasatospora TaxID=2633591 RepID=UPI0036577AFC
MPSRRRVGLAAALVSSTVIVSALPAMAAHADPAYLYVDNNNPTSCSDSGPGTEMGRPFCSIQAAADAAQPGQTIRVGGFQYTEQVTLKQSGTPGHPITIQGEGSPIGRRPHVEIAPGGYPSTTKAPHAFVASGVHDITIKNFWLSDSDEEAVLVADSERITVDGNAVTRAGAQVTKATTSPPTNPDNNTSAVRLTGKTRDVTISRNQIGGSGRAGVAIEPGVTGTIVTTNAFAGVYDFRASNIIVADSAPGTVVNSNTIGGTCGTGIVLTGSSTGSTVVNNIVQVHRNCDVNVGVGVMVASGSVPGTRSDYNVLYTDSPDTHAYSWDGTLYRSPADLAAATGQGQHDLTADPKLSDYNAMLEDVTPGADSSAVDSADATAPGQLDTDIYGNSRVDDPLVPNTGTGVGYHDRGAAEYQNPLKVSLDHGAYMPDQPMAVTFHGGTTSTWYPATTTMDFGDGSPVVTAPTFPLTHTYAAAGRYTATLTATDSNGTVKKTTTPADVASGPITAAVQVQRSASAPASIAVTGSYNSPWPVSDYSVDFGDGQYQWFRSQPAGPVTHTYAKPGRYLVRLTVRDDHGRSATADGFAHANFTDPADRAIAGRWSTGKPAANGLFNNGTWALRSTGDCCKADITQVAFGQAGDLPATADWDGLGHDQLGIYRNGTFALRHDNGTVTAIPFGDTGDIPVPGYWDGNGHAQLALYRPGIATFIVRHDDGTLTTAAFGQPGDIPVAGDWDATGHFQLGIYRAGTFALRHDDATVSTATWGNPGDQPIVGDWYAKGRMTYGIFRPTDPSYALSGAYTGIYGYAGQVY